MPVPTLHIQPSRKRSTPATPASKCGPGSCGSVPVLISRFNQPNVQYIDIANPTTANTACSTPEIQRPAHAEPRPGNASALAPRHAQALVSPDISRRTLLRDRRARQERLRLGQQAAHVVAERQEGVA